MALEKEGYRNPNQGKTTVKVPVDENGQLAPAGSTTIVTTKNFSLNTVNAENNLADNTEVLNFFLTLAQGTHDSQSNEMQVRWEV